MKTIKPINQKKLFWSCNPTLYCVSFVFLYIELGVVLIAILCLTKNNFIFDQVFSYITIEKSSQFLGLLLIKIVCLLICIAYYTLAERKIMAAIQRRRGPNVVGF